MTRDIWILVQHREGRIEETTYGLIGEGRRLAHEFGEDGQVTAVALGPGLEDGLELLGVYGVNRILSINDKSLSYYHGELFARELSFLAGKHEPALILMAHDKETEDLGPRLAAILETSMVTRAMDLKIKEGGEITAVRPVANGYLFEEVRLLGANPHIVSFLPSVLSIPEPDLKQEAEILIEPMVKEENDLDTRFIEVVEADPGELDLEEADIIIAGGRGVGRGDAFKIIHDLAKVLGGCVGGTRPIIDWQSLSFERQIGQTGKTVAPRLIFTCGISGANEFTAGMERSQLVIAINKEPRARIFRFAHLGIIGDVHEVLPLLISRLWEIRLSE